MVFVKFATIYPNNDHIICDFCDIFKLFHIVKAIYIVTNTNLKTNGTKNNTYNIKRTNKSAPENRDTDTDMIRYAPIIAC